MDTLAVLLKRFRKRRDLSQGELAIAAHIPLDTYRALEQGRNTDPKISTCVKLARALGVSLDDFAPAFESGPEPKKRTSVYLEQLRALKHRRHSQRRERE
jgi:transcriptional regulator with XRE-family HTH domain